MLVYTCWLRGSGYAYGWWTVSRIVGGPPPCLPYTASEAPLSADRMLGGRVSTLLGGRLSTLLGGRVAAISSVLSPSVRDRGRACAVAACGVGVCGVGVGVGSAKPVLSEVSRADGEAEAAVGAAAAVEAA